MRSARAFLMSGLLLLADTSGLLVGPAAWSQTTPPRVSVPRVIVGEVVWGKKFEQDLGRDLTLRVDLLGAANDGQNGIYISVINTKNPRGHQFVLLPKLINASPSNFVGTFVLPGMDPKNVSEWLMGALERVSRSGLQLTYFTGRFNQSQLQRIEDANLTLGHHGLSEEVYAKARGVLDQLEKQTGLFKVLDYKLGGDPGARGALHISYLKFSFDPGR